MTHNFWTTVLDETVSGDIFFQLVISFIFISVDFICNSNRYSSPVSRQYENRNKKMCPNCFIACCLWLPMVYLQFFRPQYCITYSMNTFCSPLLTLYFWVGWGRHCSCSIVFWGFFIGSKRGWMSTGWPTTHHHVAVCLTKESGSSEASSNFYPCNHTVFTCFLVLY